MWIFLGVSVSFGLLLSIASGGLIDGNRNSYSVACKETDDSCGNSNNRSNGCTFLKTNSTRECYVRIGFCTEQEFANLTSEICNETRTGEPDSLAKSNFYKAVGNVGVNCRKQGAYCINSSVISIVFKQQEKYCLLMNVNTTNGTSESCLTNGKQNCTQQEFRNLSEAACRANTTIHPFAEALWNTSATCKSKINECANLSSKATQYVIDEQYCYSLNMSGATKSCFTTILACTEDEFSMMKTAACGADVISTTSTSSTSNTSSTTQGTVTTRNAATTQTWDTYVKMLFLTLIVFLNHN